MISQCSFYGGCYQELVTHIQGLVHVKGNCDCGYGEFSDLMGKTDEVRISCQLRFVWDPKQRHVGNTC
jgi:hypothetical protein